MGRCMCGDTMCPSCGPAQGYNASFEAICDEIVDAVPGVADAPDMQEAIANLLWAKLDAQRDAMLSYVENLGKCSSSIVGARPPVIENMGPRQVLDTIYGAIAAWPIGED